MEEDAIATVDMTETVDLTEIVDTTEIVGMTEIVDMTEIVGMTEIVAEDPDPDHHVAIVIVTATKCTIMSSCTLQDISILRKVKIYDIALINMCKL